MARLLRILPCLLAALAAAPAARAAEPMPPTGGVPDLLQPVNVFSDHDRRRFVAAGEPCAAAVGLVDADDVEKEGTGTLVEHPRIVLTAAHVVLDVARGRPAHRIAFRLGYEDGRAAAEIGARVAAVGTTRPGTIETARDDWAILVLDRPAPSRPFALWERMTATLMARYRGALSLIAYSGDRADGERASVEHGCSVVGERYGRFLHDCSTAVGASGGALAAASGSSSCAVVGLVDGAVSPRPVARTRFRPDIANSAVMPARFAERLRAVAASLEREAR